MVKQRFQVLFRRWLFTVMKVVGPILLFEGVCVVSGSTFSMCPSAFSDLLWAHCWLSCSTALLCWLWALGEWFGSSCAGYAVS